MTVAFPHGPQLHNMLVRGGVASTNGDGKTQKGDRKSMGISSTFLHPKIVRVLMGCNPGHALPVGPFIIGSSVCLHGENESEEKVRREEVVLWSRWKKTSFARLNKLFEIAASEWDHKSSPSTSSSLVVSIELEIRVERVVSPVVCEEEDMATNLRAGFQERQCKRLSESIMVNSVPSKRLCLEPICPKPISALAPVPAPSTIAAGTIPDPDERLPSIEDTSIECLVSFPSCPKSSYIPRREEKADALFGHPADFDRDKEQSQSILHGSAPVRHFGHHHLSYHAYVGLHDFRDSGSGDSCNSEPYGAAHSTLLPTGGCRDHEGIHCP
ncbi:hypothetical protein AAG906_036300 [Vitis piasezkii]